MKVPIGFHELSSGLHQDAMLLAGGDIDRLGADCVEFVRAEHRSDLRDFLLHVLGEYTPARMNGLIKREKRDLVFRRDRGEKFLRAALTALQ